MRLPAKGYSRFAEPPLFPTSWPALADGRFREVLASFCSAGIGRRPTDGLGWFLAGTHSSSFVTKRTLPASPALKLS
jgi:hypothetical protein